MTLKFKRSRINFPAFKATPKPASVASLGLKPENYLKSDDTIKFIKFCFIQKNELNKLCKELATIQKRIDTTTSKREAKRLTRVLIYKRKLHSDQLIKTEKVGKYIGFNPVITIKSARV